MEKKNYERPEMEVIRMEHEDVICDSGDNDVDVGDLWGDNANTF